MLGELWKNLLLTKKTRNQDQVIGLVGLVAEALDLSGNLLDTSVQCGQHRARPDDLCIFCSNSRNYAGRLKNVAVFILLFI